MWGLDAADPRVTIPAMQAMNDSALEFFEPAFASDSVARTGPRSASASQPSSEPVASDAKRYRRRPRTSVDRGSAFRSPIVTRSSTRPRAIRFATCTQV